MTLPDWRQVKTIFNVAVDLPARDRTAYLQEACAGDAQLKNEVETSSSRNSAEEAWARYFAPDAPMGNISLRLPSNSFPPHLPPRQWTGALRWSVRFWRAWCIRASRGSSMAAQQRTKSRIS